MARRWNPKLIMGGAARSKSAQAWVAEWQRMAVPRGRIAEIRTMIWAGLLIGLLAFHAGRAGLDWRVPWPDREGNGRIEEPWDRSGGEHVPGPVRVIDGDTFEHGGVRVRIADIDTPEVHGRCAYETRLAARATARMRTLLAAGPFELHRVDRDEDRYGRKLRIVTRGGRSLGDVLVAEGLARTWSGRREPWC